MGRLVIVGGSMGGLRAAEQLRRSGWVGELIVVSDEPHLPYNRPPLSKELLKGMAETATVAADHHASVAFRLRDSIADVEWRLGTAAVGCDLAAHSLTLADGETITYDGLVAATGLRPRRLPIEGPSAGRYVVRTLDDAVCLRAGLLPGAKVAVIGGGFIGCEVAATARALGCEVVVIEPLAVPMEAALGPELGRALQAHHERRGVDFRLGRLVTGINAADDDPERVGAVILDDGSRLEAEVVVESIGSHTNVEWLGGNGLDLSDGLLCDNWLRVEGREDLVAVGDIARFPNPRYDERPRRVEHWSIPADTAKRAARTLTDYLHGSPPDPDVFAPLPTFWSDQFELRVQACGAPGLASEIQLLEGRLDDSGEGLEAGVAIGYLERGHLIGVVTVGLPPKSMLEYRRQLDQAPLEV